MLTEGHATVNRVLRWRCGILTRPARHDERASARRPREQRRAGDLGRGRVASLPAIIGLTSVGALGAVLWGPATGVPSKTTHWNSWVATTASTPERPARSARSIDGRTRSNFAVIPAASMRKRVPICWFRAGEATTKPRWRSENPVDLRADSQVAHAHVEVQPVNPLHLPREVTVEHIEDVDHVAHH